MNAEQNDKSSKRQKSLDRIMDSREDEVIKISNIQEHIVEQLSVKAKEEGITIFSPATRTSSYTHLAKFDEIEEILDRIDIKGNKFAQAMDLIFNADCDINGGYHKSLGGLLDTVNRNFGGLSEDILKQSLKNYYQGNFQGRDDGCDGWDIEAAHTLLILFKLFENYKSLVEIFEEVNREFLRLSKQVKISNHNRKRKSKSKRSYAYSDAWEQGQRSLLLHIHHLEIDREIGDRSQIASTLDRLGDDCYKLQNYRQAIDHYQQSLEVYQEIENRSKIASSLKKIAHAYFSLKDYQQAINYYQQSLDINRELDNGSQIAGSLKEIAHAYYELKNHLQAIEHHQQSLNIYQELNNRYEIASSLHYLGQAFSSLEDYQQAIDYYQQSLDIYLELGEDSYWVRTERGIANFPRIAESAIADLQQKLKSKKDFLQQLANIQQVLAIAIAYTQVFSFHSYS